MITSYILTKLLQKIHDIPKIIGVIDWDVGGCGVYAFGFFAWQILKR